MNERLPAQTVAIDSHMLRESATLACLAFREAGIDPTKALRNRMAKMLLAEWFDGNCNRATFVFACRKLLAMNPTLAL